MAAFPVAQDQAVRFHGLEVETDRPLVDFMPQQEEFCGNLGTGEGNGGVLENAEDLHGLLFLFFHHDPNHIRLEAFLSNSKTISANYSDYLRIYIW